MLAELARSYDVSRSTISILRHRDSTRAKVHDLGRYLELIVEPTFDEFEKNRASVRHAFLTCVAIYHAIDRVSYPNKPGNLRKEWGKHHWNLSWLILSRVTLNMSIAATR
jgi:hypothetical protein